MSLSERGRGLNPGTRTRSARRRQKRNTDVWAGLSLRWQKALRSTVWVWMRHVSAGGYDEEADKRPASCFLCALARKHADLGDSCVTRGCPVAKQKESDQGCFKVRGFRTWDEADGDADALYRGARGTLQYLSGFLPKDDPVREAVGALLERTKKEE